MSTYHYKAMRADGTEYEGSLEAPDKFAIYRQVKKEGGSVLSVSEKGEKGGTFDFRKLNIAFSSVKEDDKIAFAKNLSAMISAGLSLSRALAVLGRQTKSPKLKGLLTGMEEKVKQGSSFHEALAETPKVWSSLMIAMVKAGEESGQLSTSLMTIGVQLERAHNIKKKVRGAMLYPSIVLFALVVIAYFMLTTIVPTLRQTFEELDADLPASTQFILAASNFLTQNTILAIMLFAVVIGGFVTGMRTKQGKRYFEWTILHMPVIKTLVKEVNAARIARTLSSLLSAGVEVLAAIDITQEVSQNSYYKETLEDMKKKIGQGLPIAEVFEHNEHLYPPFFGELVAVGEETGKLPEMLTRIADYYENEVEQSTKDMSTIIEPFLMLLVGGVVGFFAISMITPIYSISQNI